MSAGAHGADYIPSRSPWKPVSAGQDAKRQAPSPKSCCLFGLETKPELVWEEWNQRGKYTKTLMLKNTENSLQKFYLRPPESKFFSTSISTLVISPGTSFPIPVTFTPLQSCEYEDSLEFQGKDGSFKVFLRAIIPCHKLEVPDSVMLPVCAVQHSSHASFVLKNASILQTCFQWVCAAPFQLSPTKGLLKPGQDCQITVVFCPQEALVYQGYAYCRFGEDGDKVESTCTVVLQAIAKYPQLEFRTTSSTNDDGRGTPVLRFGSLAVGQCSQKKFDIFNPSPVTASFSLSRLSGGVSLLGSEFSCDVAKGEILPGGSLRAVVTFSPTMVDNISVEYLCLKYSGALDEPLLKLIGSCKGPKVSFSSSVVDFGCVGEGESVVQTVKFINSSAAEAMYQWDIDSSGNSVFSILPASGTVLPHSRITVKIAYRPTQPIVHYRKVACLILHRDPVFLELLGTCHSDLQQPVVLKPEHLIQYKLHWSHRQHSSDTASASQQDNDINLDGQRVCSFENEQSLQEQNSTAGMSTMEEFFLTNLSFRSTLSPPHVTVDPAELLFNHQKPFGSSSFAFSQYVEITNHTKGKLSLIWTLTEHSPFSVSPPSCDLSPHQRNSFKVTYNPKQPNTVHGAQLECFAFFKDNLDPGQQLLCPPWCVTVRVIGHSFQPGKQRFIPHCSLNAPQVVFPPLSIVSYRMVLLKNDGDLPFCFCVDQSSKKTTLPESLTIMPMCGLIQPGDHQIISFRTIPSDDSPTEGFNLLLQLNGSNFTKELKVVSVSEKPCVSLEVGTTLYFQPTVVGSQTRLSHQIRNLSSLPLRFQWSVPEADRELIFFKPDAGELHPNESSMQTWLFSPLEAKTYTLQPTLSFWPTQTDDVKKSHLALVMVGKGCNGCIEAEEAVLDVGDIAVGCYQSVEVPLVNNSSCSVSFSLLVEQKLLQEDLGYDFKDEPCALHFDTTRGTIDSNTTMQLQSAVRPKRCAQYIWTISYQIINHKGCALSPFQTLCEVRAKSVVPSLQVVDGCTDGSMRLLSKVHLWKLFSLDSLNEHLISNPSDAELTVNSPKSHSCFSTLTKTILEFNFSSAAVNSEPSSAVLMFHNPGSFPVDWALLFPEDMLMELEHWVATEDLSSTKLQEMKLQFKRLFSISPRSGTLLPGHRKAVKLSYSHSVAGRHQFPVVFKLPCLREIWLNFKGMTVEREKPCLQFFANHHVFSSVILGCSNPPKQVFELHNGGAVPVYYSVDRAVLSQLQMDNFDHPVLRCLNPEGEVPPGKTAQLEWIFFPLEAKMYQMEVPILIQGGDSTLVKFEGCGILTPKPDPSNSKTLMSTPGVERFPFPGQLFSLSEERFCLGDIPVTSKASRIFFLTNETHAETLYYEWDLQQQTNHQVVQIKPDRGCVLPGECALCALTFTSTDYPTVYQFNLFCRVTQEAALKQYYRALKRWEDGNKRQEEIILEHTDVAEKQKVIRDEEAVGATSRNGSPFAKYKPLPPIGTSRGGDSAGSRHTNMTRAERQLQSEAAKISERPKPPQPALLHLEVAAHSHELPQFKTYFTDLWEKCPWRLQSVNAPPRLPAPTPALEKDTFAQIFFSQLREQLDDPTFLNNLLPRNGSNKPSGKLSSHSSSFSSSSSSSTSSSAAPLPQPPSSGLADMREAAGSSGNRLQTQKTQKCEQIPDDVYEEILIETLQNLMMEAVRGEFDLTAEPLDFLPPASNG